MNTIKEVWKEVASYNDLYQVSNVGNIKRIAPRIRLLSPYNNGNNYLRVSLSRDGIITRPYVHRLVAQAFLPPPRKEQIEVNHCDGNPMNNQVSNLEWVTRLQNERHAIALLGKSNAGEANGQSILTTKEVQEIRQLYSQKAYTRKELATRFNISYGTICDIISRKRWKHI